MRPFFFGQLFLVASLTGTACQRSSSALDASASPAPDLTTAALDMSGRDGAVRCRADSDCEAGSRCYQNGCIPDNGLCTTDDECENDTYCACAVSGDGGPCASGICVARTPGHASSDDCANYFSNTEFLAPKVLCAWPEGSSGGRSAVIADLDGDSYPEAIVETYAPPGITAFHARDCSLFFRRDLDLGNFEGELAVGDLDGDKVPEIVLPANGSGFVTVLDNRGNLLATAVSRLQRQDGDPVLPAAPAIADVDGRAPPEIIAGSMVMRYHKGSPTLELVWNQPVHGQPFIDPTSVVADLDGDGQSEVLVNADIYDGPTGTDKTPALLTKTLSSPIGAYPALGDFNGDGHPDIVYSQDWLGRERVSVYDYKNDRFLFGPFGLGELGSGPPTVADVDGDGVPEFMVATKGHLTVFSLKKNGVLWQRTTQDGSSWSTVASAFDFNGDGAYDLAYRDECFLHFYDGPSGRPMATVTVTSTTGLEMPTIADVDGDGHAELIVTSDDMSQLGYDWCFHLPDFETGTPFSGYTSSIFVFKDPRNRWMPARPVWNEHAYHGTNIRDDLSVPNREVPSWTASNTYRAQPSLTRPKKLPDFTAGAASGGVEVSSMDCSTHWDLAASLCNRGAVVAPAPVPGTFYRGDPRQPGADKLCSTATSGPLAPGDCEAVSCTWASPPMAPVDLWFRADDDGTQAPVAECNRGNDLLLIAGAHCTKVQ